MKALSKNIGMWVLFIGLLPGFCLAGSYIETRPEYIDSLRVGQQHDILWAPTGQHHRIEIVGIENDSATDGIRVHFKHTGILITNFSDEKIEFTPDPIDEVITSTAPRKVKSAAGSVALTTGAGAAGIAGVQYLLIEDSSVKRKIDAAYRRINELREQMGYMWEQVESGYISLRDDIVAVNTKVVSRTSDYGLQRIQISTGAGREVYAVADRTHADLRNLEWLSEDQEFAERANLIRAQLLTARLDSPLKRNFYEISKTSLIHADRTSFVGDKEGADFLLDIAQKSADVLVGLDPFTGFARNIYETFTGKNLITGLELTEAERVLAAIGVITGGAVAAAAKAYRLLAPIAKKIAPRAIRTFQAVRQFLSRTGNGFELVGGGTEVRKIHLRSPANSKWGFRPDHLNKHFFGYGRHSLSIIDPKGNPDIWMSNILDTVQRAPTKVHRGGIIDILHTYEKADKSGVYKLGVRLHQRPDKSYDLVTILTDQRR